jgi:hypothetical protein
MKRSKAMDMRFHWTQDKVTQGTYSVTWKQGKGNAADYFTKSHPPAHHKAIRSTYLDVQYERDHLPPSSKGVLMQPVMMDPSSQSMDTKMMSGDRDSRQVGRLV